jgi:hypothetical protein
MCFAPACIHVPDDGGDFEVVMKVQPEEMLIAMMDGANFNAW